MDCGGSCAACPVGDATCRDGVRNGEETGVDCGGPCPTCATPPPPPPATDECPISQEITSLQNVIGVERRLDNGRTLKVLQGDVAAARGAARLTIALVNADDSFPTGTYTVGSDGSIPGICQHHECVSFTYSLEGEQFGVLVTSGTLEIREAADRLVGSLRGTRLMLQGLQHTFRDFRHCATARTIDLSFDVAPEQR